MLKVKNLLRLCWQEASGNCCLLQPTGEIHINICVETPISALQSMTSQRREAPLRMISTELHWRMLNMCNSRQLTCSEVLSNHRTHDLKCQTGSSLQRSKAERCRDFLHTATCTHQRFCPSRLLPAVLTKNI